MHRNRFYGGAGNSLPRYAFVAVLMLAVAAFSGVPATSASAPGSPDAMMVPANFTELAEQAGPAVVNIRTVKTVSGGTLRNFMGPFGGGDDRYNDFFERFFGDQYPRERKERSLGSGFIMDPKGLIVTNNHVVEKAEEISVKLAGGKEYKAEVIGRDPKTDLALIKIEADRKLPSLPLGDSQSLRVGEWVVAIGSPFGLEHTVTAGIVSAKGRVIGAGPYDDFIQTDAAINPGNSGGPLLNLAGEVVGINTAIVAHGQGIGFAIPIKLARSILNQLEEAGEVTRGWLGVQIQDVTEEMSEYYDLPDNEGAIVAKVFEGDPADKAGIMPMDVIREVNGQKIEDMRDLTGIIANIPVGEQARVTVWRDGKLKTLSVEIAKRDDETLVSAAPGGEPDGQAAGMLGLMLIDITQELAQRFNLNTTDGVIVENVEPGSKAAEAGVVRGDIIRQINRQPVTSVADFREKLGDIEEGGQVSLLIIGEAGFKVVKITK